MSFTPSLILPPASHHTPLHSSINQKMVHRISGDDSAWTETAEAQQSSQSPESKQSIATKQPCKLVQLYCTLPTTINKPHSHQRHGPVPTLLTLQIQLIIVNLLLTLRNYRYEEQHESSIYLLLLFSQETEEAAEEEDFQFSSSVNLAIRLVLHQESKLEESRRIRLSHPLNGLQLQSNHFSFPDRTQTLFTFSDVVVVHWVRNGTTLGNKRIDVTINSPASNKSAPGRTQERNLWTEEVH